ncbi:hypothetical protein HHI36_021562 [Cryptolaemus montrouzieri]|uniref:Uncharacterized protein n=1 Tax=Cryptolaemus montrouzieri TaxID=559131 RepID=A0ABD2MY91_9CUCU
MQKLDKIEHLNIDDVNKKILAKEPFVRPDYDIINPTGNYQDEDYKNYKDKLAKFYEISGKYQEFNEQTFVTSKIKTHKDYEIFIEENSGNLFDQEKEETESEILKQFYHKLNSYDTNGKRERRRLVRNIHEKFNTETEEFCIEPWFKRYLILNKFIHHARATILKKRLLKNLERLKKLDKEKIEELEKQHLKCKNESYGELFKQFL